MNIQFLEDTCSCVHLHGVHTGILSGSPYYFKKELRECLGARVFYDIKKDRVTNYKSIIYFTNYSWFADFQQRWILYKTGFRKIGSYRSSYGTVNIMLCKKGKLKFT